MPTTQQIITEKFTAALAAGDIPWRKPWVSRAPKNLITRKPYRGINSLILGLFGSGEYYLTFHQAHQLGGHIKKGSKSLQICYYKNIKDEDNDRNYRLLRYYNVFPALCAEGIGELPAAPQELQFVPQERAESLLVYGESLLASPVVYGSHRAAYSPSTHTIEMPERSAFVSISEFYGTAFHELGHSLCEPDQRAEVEPYSFEELCAEIFSCFVLSDCTLLSEDTFTNSQAYVQGWAKKLQSNPELLLKAAFHASKRYDKLPLGA